MDDQETSSGLIVGLIVGGVVIVVLLVAVAFGAGFFFLAHDAAMPVAAPPVMVVAEAPIAEERFDPAPVPPPVEAKPLAAPPAGIPIENPRALLVGVWDRPMAPAGGRLTFEAHKDGTFTLSASTKGVGEIVIENKGRWEVRKAAEGADWALVRTWDKEVPKDIAAGRELTLRFLDNNRFWLDGANGGETYQRRVAPAK